MNQQEAISNRADWLGTIYVVDADNGDPVDVSSVTEIQIELEDPDTKCAALTGSLTGGEVVLQDAAGGIYTYSFPASKTRALEQKRYIFAGRIIAGSDTRQIFFTPLHVYDGVVG